MTGSPSFWSVLGGLLPLALAGTFSWLPVTGVVVLLLAGGGRSRAVVFLVGRLAGLALITVAFVVGARALPPVPRLDSRLVAGTEVVVGLALVVVGVVTWLRRHHVRQHQAPAWIQRLGDASAPAVLLTSVLVDLQPKGLLLGLAAGAVVRGGSLPVPQAVLAVVVYLVVAGSSVLLPVVATYAAPRRTRRWLQATQDWLGVHGASVAAVVVGVVGAVLVGDGLRRF